MADCNYSKLSERSEWVRQCLLLVDHPMACNRCFSAQWQAWQSRLEMFSAFFGTVHMSTTIVKGFDALVMHHIVYNFNGVISMVCILNSISYQCDYTGCELLLH